MVSLILFFLIAAVLMGATVGVVTARNPVYSAVLLVLSFVTSAVLWLLLEAEFLSIVLVLVYVGAVMVLFLFVVMMLDVNATVSREGFTRYAPLGAIVSGLVIFELVSVIWMKNSGLPVTESLKTVAADYSNTREIGLALYGSYLFEFELAAFLLLLAIVAAIMLTLRRRPGLKYQDVAAQVKVRRQDRVRVVSMPAERDE